MPFLWPRRRSKTGSRVPVLVSGDRGVGGTGVVLCQSAVPDYRQAVLELLIQRLGPSFRVYSGNEHFVPSVKTNVHLGTALWPLRNRYLLGRRLLWQSGAMSAASSAEVAILEFNPRILSVWACLIVRRLRRRPSLLWGHAWSRRGQRSRTALLRRTMRKLADGVVLYTSAQARELTESDAHAKLFVAPNAIYRADEMTPVASLDAPSSFIYVGRLVPEKKPDMLLAAFIESQPALPDGTRLVLVGDGPMMSQLRETAARSSAADRVDFHGHVSDVAVLRDLYATAIAGVSPGPVGLSLIQSLGFGVPMIVARDEPHGPEVEAALDGWNAVMYSPSTCASLARALLSAVDGRSDWYRRRAAISRDCRERYSAEAMADGLLSAVEAMRQLGREPD